MSAGRLEVRGLGVTLGRVPVLRDVDLVVEPGTWTAVVGPNGAGKSTLLRAVAGLVRYRGQALLDGRDLARVDARRRATCIGYAPQVPVLPDAMSVQSYVELGRTPHHSLLSGPRRADRAVVDEALERLDLGALAGRSLRTLSGGERQRAVLARALAQQPQLLLLDEPTTALDLGHAQQLLEAVDGLRVQQGLTVVSTLHDLTLAGQYAGHLSLLVAGAVVATGAPQQVLTARNVAEHYGAVADVLADADGGGVRVVPVRPHLPDLATLPTLPDQVPMAGAGAVAVTAGAPGGDAAASRAVP